MRCKPMRRAIVGSVAVLAMAGPLHAQGAARTTYARFTPGGCVQAPAMVGEVANRDPKPGPTFTPAADSMPTIAVDSSRLCQGAVGATANDPWALLDVARVDLVLGQDSLAWQAQQRYLADLGTSSPQRPAWALYLVASDNAGAHPARLAPARAALTQLDALGAPAAKARVLAHYAMARASLRSFDDQ